MNMMIPSFARPPRRSAAFQSALNPLLKTLHNGISTQLDVPKNLIPRYTNERQRLDRPMMTTEEQDAVINFYREHKGYALDWGHIIEERNTSGTVFHFVPEELIEAGAKIRALHFIARDWYSGMEPVVRGMASLVDGPEFIPLSLSAESELTREWLAEVFLPAFWPSLMASWKKRLAFAEETLLEDDEDEENAVPNKEISLIATRLIYRPSYLLSGELNTNVVHAIFVTVEDDPRMCFASFSAEHGLSNSGWIPLPKAQNEFDAPPVDYIIDFHKGSGAIALDLTMPEDLRLVPQIVQQLLLAVRISPDEPHIRRTMKDFLLFAL